MVTSSRANVTCDTSVGYFTILDTTEVELCPNKKLTFEPEIRPNLPEIAIFLYTF